MWIVKADCKKYFIDANYCFQISLRYLTIKLSSYCVWMFSFVFKANRVVPKISFYINSWICLKTSFAMFYFIFPNRLINARANGKMGSTLVHWKNLSSIFYFHSRYFFYCCLVFKYFLIQIVLREVIIV